MNFVIVLLFVKAILSLNCNLFDFSKSKVACALSCPLGTSQFSNFCLNSNQYISNSQVLTCSGTVSLDRTVCCGSKQYVEGTICLDCNGQVYSNGLACCPNDHYLDYSQGTPNCIQFQTGNCPTITYSFPYKICCPAQQLYNIATNNCASSFSLNCDSSLLICCPSGQMLEYSEQQYTCTSTCSWKSSSNLFCQGKYCNTQLSSILAGPNQFPSLMLSLNGKCCYGLDSSSNCIADPNACIASFANRGWSICCTSGQYYSISSGSCLADCTIGYVLLGFLCVTQNQAVDMRSMLGKPI